MSMLIVIWQDPSSETIMEQFNAEGLEPGVYLVPHDKMQAFRSKWQPGGAEPDGMVVLEVAKLNSYFSRTTTMNASQMLQNAFPGVQNFTFGH